MSNITDADKRALIVIAWVVFGGAALIIGAIVALSIYVDATVKPAGPNEQALLKAIAARDVAAAKAALASGVDFNVAMQPSPDSQERNTLTWLLVEEMAGLGDIVSRDRPRDPELLEIARAMFEAGADPNQSVSFSTSPGNAGGGRSPSASTRHLIVLAVRTENVQLIETMIRAGLDVKSNGTGEALVEACRTQLDNVAAALVAAGANVNHRAADNGRTPLSEAVHNRRRRLIERLEQAGAVEWGKKDESPSQPSS
jgi:ankyrin repeat protein